MKKRLFSLALALALCLGLAVPALAVDVSGLDAATAWAYYNALTELIQTEGIRSIDADTGVAYAALEDMDADGTPELITIAVGYQEQLRINIWTMKNGSIDPTFQYGGVLGVTNGRVALARKNGRICLYYDYTWSSQGNKGQCMGLAYCDGTYDETSYYTGNGFMVGSPESITYDKTWAVDSTPLLTCENGWKFGREQTVRDLHSALTAKANEISATTSAPAPGTFGPLTVTVPNEYGPSLTIAFSSATLEKRVVSTTYITGSPADPPTMRSEEKIVVTIEYGSKITLPGNSELYNNIGATFGSVENGRYSTGVGADSLYGILKDYADFAKVNDAFFVVEGEHIFVLGNSNTSPSVPSNPSTPETPAPSTPTEQPTTQPTNADRYPYSIPSTPNFLRFSTSPTGSYRTTVPEFDANDNVYDKEVTVYEFEAGTKLGLTAESIQRGYSIANVSSDDFEDMDRSEFTLTKGSLSEQWFMVSGPQDPEGFIAYVHPINTNTTFQDVKAGAYYENAVKWAVKYGITNGTSNTSFTPGRTCSNAEILTMVYRAFEWMPVLGNNPFTDVKQSDYYYEAARWAAEYDIVSGTTFDPNKPCTRAMAVAYIWKAMDGLNGGSSITFTDVPATADYAKAVAWAVGAGITNGTSATTFSPNDTCTRGQIVTFLHRAMG